MEFLSFVFFKGSVRKKKGGNYCSLTHFEKVFSLPSFLFALQKESGNPPSLLSF